MKERSYTVGEIDQMRRAISFCESRKGMVYQGDGHWQGSSDSGLQSRVEDMLRTYMVGGVEPDELVEKAKKVQERMERQREPERQSSIGKDT